jgi:hypothetical protein
MAFGPAQLDAPPPSPVTSPPAARESSQLGMLTGGAPPLSGMAGPGGGGPSGMPQGPDLTGIMALGSKIDEGVLTLASVMPEVAPQLDQARELIANAVASFIQTVSGSQGAAPGIPGAPGGTAGMPRGGGVVQAGNQFPGGGFGAGRVA